MSYNFPIIKNNIYLKIVLLNWAYLYTFVDHLLKRIYYFGGWRIIWLKYLISEQRIDFSLKIKSEYVTEYFIIALTDLKDVVSIFSGEGE